MTTVQQRKNGGYGFIPSLPDPRDQVYRVRLGQSLSSLPDKVDQRDSIMPAVYDQGALGSCTANASSGMVERLLGKEGHPEFTPSRLFTYYWERFIEGSVDTDSGAMTRDALKVLHHYGFVNETLWPYDIPRFTVEPSQEAIEAASKERVLRYSRVPVNTYASSLSSALHHTQFVLAEDLSIIFGFTVFESFEQDLGSNGIMPAPRGRIMGGHCVMACGYTTINGELHIIVRNSWGAGWGDSGYFYMPAELYASRLCTDFWTARLTTPETK